MKKFLVLMMAVCTIALGAATVSAKTSVDTTPAQKQECCQAQEGIGINGNIIDAVKGQTENSKCDCCKKGCTCGDCDACKVKCNCCDKCTCGCNENKACSCGCKAKSGKKCKCKKK